MTKLEILESRLKSLLADKITVLSIAYSEITIEIDADNLESVMETLNRNEELKFEQCVDLCGVDFKDLMDSCEQDADRNICFIGANHKLRFAVVYHLLSLTHNWRLRLRVFVKNNEFPVIKSMVFIYNSLDWFEREAFDMYGIIFDGHPDLRRILTDYGFIGHPMRKDFPVSGFMEMKYDPEQKRVVYQKVTIEPREITPRIIRAEDSYGRN